MLQYRVSFRPILVALAISLGWLLAANAGAGERGHCIRAEVPATLVLPDGSTHDPGTIRICMTGKFSPVAGFHTIHVGGVAHGRFISQLDYSEATTDGGSPYLQFARTDSGKWILEGYAVPAGERMRLYRVQWKQKRRADQWRAELHSPRSDDEAVLLLATVTK